MSGLNYFKLVWDYFRRSAMGMIPMFILIVFLQYLGHGGFYIQYILALRLRFHRFSIPFFGRRAELFNRSSNEESEGHPNL